MIPFITTDDLLFRIPVDYYETLTQGSPNVEKIAMDIGKDMCFNYLNSKYYCDKALMDYEDYDPAVVYTQYDRVSYATGTASAVEYVRNYATASYTAGTSPTNSTYWVQGRNDYQLLKIKMIDILLFYLYSNLNPQNADRIRSANFEAAQDWLIKVHRGELITPLPLRFTKTNKVGDIPAITPSSRVNPSDMPTQTGRDLNTSMFF